MARKVLMLFMIGFCVAAGNALSLLAVAAVLTKVQAPVPTFLYVLGISVVCYSLAVLLFLTLKEAEYD